MLKKNLLCSLVILLAIGSPAFARNADSTDSNVTARVGEAAPEFALTSIDGKKVSLSDYKGKIVVLEWTNHECPVVGRYVTKQKSMQKTFATLKKTAAGDTTDEAAGSRINVVWLAIDSSHFCQEKKDKILKYYKELKLDYPYLLDPTGRIGRSYGAKTTPHMYVVDAKGTLIYAGSLDDDQYGGAENPRNFVAKAVTAALNGSTVEVSKTKPFGCSVKYKKN